MLHTSHYCSSFPARGRRRSLVALRSGLRVWAIAAICWFVATRMGHCDEPKNGEPSEPVSRVDFRVEIEPIFKAHCWKCHGPEKRSGGLRLDRHADALAGGDSGKPIVDSPPDESELFERISSSDRSFRMPKNAEPLAPAEIEKIRHWLEQGSPWPDSDGAGVAKAPYERWLGWWLDLIDRYRYEYERARPLGALFFLVQVGLLAVTRIGRAWQSERAWTRGRLAWLCRRCAQVRPSELAVTWLLSVACLALGLLVIHQQKLSAQIDDLRAYRAKSASHWAKTIYGSPPVPIRPDHGKQVAVTYYRGNCERNPALFNGGNYLTAIFRLSLCDKDHNPLEVGDPVPTDGLFVRMELERAPGTTDTLFSSELMQSVFLSEQFYETSNTPLRDQPTILETIDQGWRWVAFVPLGRLAEKKSLNGLIYVYTGRVENGTARGEPHYAIRYDLITEQGRLSDQSDLWMNSFGNGAVALPEPAGKIPYREWFDYRPIPPIEGENTKDPKLLGVEEYVRKGLIQAPPQSGERQPDVDRPTSKPPADSAPREPVRDPQSER